MELSFSTISNPVIPERAITKVTQMNHVVEVQYLEHRNTEPTIRKLDKDNYLILQGDNRGVIKKFQHIDNRSSDKISLSRTFRKLRYLINNNFSGKKNELFITLTYAESMTDEKRLYKDCKRFFNKLKYYYDFDYISVIEPQGDGKKYGNEWHANTWHCHVLMRFNDVENIYIDNEWLRNKWGNGWVNIRKINGLTDNIGAYLTAYLADIPVNDINNFDAANDIYSSGRSVIEKEVVNFDGSKEKKSIIKGGRLALYPPGINLYRKSKGILMPESYFMPYEMLSDVVGSAKPHYIKGIEMVKTDDDSLTPKHFNTVIYENYNLKRE